MPHHLLDVLEVDDEASVSAYQHEARAAIAGMSGVAEVRGAGLLIGVVLDGPRAHAVYAAGLERGLIVNAPNDTTIRLAPPLIIGDAEITEFLTTFTDALEATA